MWIRDGELILLLRVNETGGLVIKECADVLRLPRWIWRRAKSRNTI
tara:strand:+ start:359 stop:496 length:138 start_codon:yes stop_codon:yes gene_type:complete